MLKKIDEFLHSDYLYVIVGLFMFVFWNYNMTTASYCFLALVASLCFFACKELTPFAVIICMMPCVKHFGFTISKSFILILIPFAILLIASIVYYIVKNFVKEKKKFRAGALWLGLLLAFIACFCSGFFTPFFTIPRMLASTGIVVLSAFVYLILLNTTGEALKESIYKILLTLSLLAIAQSFVFYFSVDEGFFDIVFSKRMHLGWITTNSVATLLVMTMPFCQYQTLRSKRPWLHFLIFIFLGVNLLITLSRNSFLCAAVVLPISTIYTFLKANKSTKKQMLWVTFGFIVFAAVFYLTFKSGIDMIIDGMVERGVNSRGRTNIWKYCLGEFKKYPSFGIGFFGEDMCDLDYPARLLHNTPLQILCCTGIIGTILFIPYFYQRYKLLISKFSLFKLFALFSVAIWEIGGLFDLNFIKVFELVIIYSIMAACENEQNREPYALTKSKKSSKITSGK